MTTNDMIYKTITTKVTKEPKFKSILEDMGFKVYDSTWGACKCWAVSNPKTNRMVVFSKGYDRRKRLYDEACDIPTNDFKKVDYVNYLKTDRDYIRDGRSKYAILRASIKANKDHVRWYENDVARAFKSLEECQKLLAYYEKKLKESREKLDIDRIKVEALRNKRSKGA